MQTKPEDGYRFIVSVFGNGYNGMLLSCLHSIAKNAGDAKISVFWQDVDPEFINDLEAVFKADFNETDFDFSSNRVERISSKTLIWSLAAKKYAGENLCMVDVDTLVVRDISDFFNQQFDVGFTFKNEIYPLNTGVLLAKGERAVLFFEEWRKMTLEIIKDEDKFNQANSRDYPYGGADQMALHEIIKYKRSQKDYAAELKGREIFFKGFPCSFLNQTNSGAIKKETHIIHYKGGWQLILFQGLSFTRKRKMKESWEMYLFYLKNFQKALLLLNKSSGREYNKKFPLIKIPFYLNSDFERNEFLYLINLVRSFFVRSVSKIKSKVKTIR